MLMLLASFSLLYPFLYIYHQTFAPFLCSLLHVTSKLNIRGGLYVRCYCFLLFVTIKTGFVQLWVCSALPEGEWFTAVGTPVPACAPSLIVPDSCSSVPRPASPLPEISAVVAGLYFSTQHHCVGAVNISFYTE